MTSWALNTTKQGRKDLSRPFTCPNQMGKTDLREDIKVRITLGKNDFCA